jgi:RNA polymerase sigma-70 factor (ECF subfamily)
MTVDENVIVDQIRSGQVQAFQELVDQYKKKVYYLAYDMMGNHEDAEDVSQEVFLRAFRFMKDFRGDAKLSSWLYRITHNVCIDQRRKKPLAIISLNPDPELGVAEMEIEDKSSGPQETLQARMLQKDIQKALDVLTPRERSVFVMRHYNDMMVREIAEILKISDGTVKSLLFRAVRRLRKALAPYEADSPGRSE